MLELATVPPEPAREAALRAVASRIDHALQDGDPAAAADAFDQQASAAAEHGASQLVLAAEPADGAVASLVERLDLRLQREVLQLRRPLPAPQHATVTVRPFVAGSDDDAWLEVNNRAFAWHPDQSNWTADDLARTSSEPWFDPAGFLLHEVDGRLAAFCWTKIHGATDPPLGEIFVIAVDPSFHGKGLGRELTLAGLDWLGDRGLTTAMLYVEADNVPARRLYEQLGFTVHHAKRWWVRDLVTRTGTVTPRRG